MIHTVTGNMTYEGIESSYEAALTHPDLPAKVDIFIDLEAAKEWITGSD